MKGLKTLNARRLSVVGFSFFFAYILSFQFEGQVLYSLLICAKQTPAVIYWLQLLRILQGFLPVVCLSDLRLPPEAWCLSV